MELIYVLLLTAVWFLMFSIGVWWLTRLNAQLKRLKNEPTPKKAFGILVDDVEAQDLLVRTVKRDLDGLRDEFAGVHDRIRSIQNKAAAQTRRDAGVDLEKLADYVQAATTETAQAPTQQVPTAGTLIETPDGEVIDYR